MEFSSKTCGFLKDNVSSHILTKQPRSHLIQPRPAGGQLLALSRVQTQPTLPPASRASALTGSLCRGLLAMHSPTPQALSHKQLKLCTKPLSHAKGLSSQNKQKWEERRAREREKKGGTKGDAATVLNSYSKEFSGFPAHRRPSRYSQAKANKAAVLRHTAGALNLRLAETMEMTP